MIFNRIKFVLAAVASSCAFAHAQIPAACAAGKLDLVYHRADLPLPVQQMLLKEGAMADRGEDYSVSDQGGLPRRRFGVGALAANKVFVAVEYGGIASGVDFVVFRMAGGQWMGESSRSIARVPASESEVRWVICNGKLPPPPVADQQNRVKKL